MKTLLAIILATVCGLAIITPTAKTFHGELSKITNVLGK